MVVTAPGTEVLAAGAVVFRPGSEVLLVHRPKYDDWSFPKGKLDPGEHLTACAVREVQEETGLRVRLGPPLPAQRYPIAGGRHKTVSYWVGRTVADDDVSGYRPNAEIDRVEWVPHDVAKRLLTYAHDRETLEVAHRLRKRTRPLVVLRHGHAFPRKRWTEDDRCRPLHTDGLEQSQALVAVLAAYDVSRIVTSSSTRCVQTVEPYGEASGRPLERTAVLSEEDATAEGVGHLLDELVAARDNVVVCTHRPVLPCVFDALDVDDPGLGPGSMLVAHLRRGEVVATEVHRTA